MHQQRTTLALLFGTALVFRVVFFFLVAPYNQTVQKEIVLVDDALGYHQLAQTVVSSHEFAFEEGGTPDTLRTPLYPFFIAFFYFLFGALPWIPILAQVILDSVSCVLLYSIVLAFASRRIAFISAVLYALDPFFIFYSSVLFSDVLFVFCVLTATLFFTKALKREFDSASRKHIVIAGILFGLATLIRPISQYLVILIPLFVIVLLRRNLRQGLVAGLLFASTFIVAISPWVIRNVLTYNTTSISTSGSINLLLLFVSPMEAERREQSTDIVTIELEHEADSLIQHAEPNPSSLNGFQRAEYWKNLAMSYIQGDPMAFAKHYVIGIVHSFANLCTKDFALVLGLPSEVGDFDIKGQKNVFAAISYFFRRKSSYEIAIGLVILVYLLITYFSMAIGFVISWKTLNRSFLILCFLLAAYFVFLAGPYGLARFKLPAIPFYLTFSGVGIDFLVSKLKRKEAATLKELKM